MGGQIKHIRVNNEEGDKYSLGKSKECFDSIWDLVEAQLDRKLKSTKGDEGVELVYVRTAPCPHTTLTHVAGTRCRPSPR